MWNSLFEHNSLSEDITTIIAKKSKEYIDGKLRGNRRSFAAPDEEYIAKASQVIPATVRAFSGCKDTQTSADVSDVSSFNLPPVSEAEKAGGACTNGLLACVKNNPNISFGHLLVAMRDELQKRGYEQIPQLSSSNNVELTRERFSPMNPNSNGRTKALLIGINYKTHSQGRLNGCVNDILSMRNYLVSQGYNSQNIVMLADDPQVSQASPTGAEIVRCMNDLVKGAQSGDSLFLHYSGHGTQVKDTNGDEVDGMDEVIVPVDYETSGMITDDTIFQILVAKLPAGVTLTCVFDCCHSGTVLDLPFICQADGKTSQDIESGQNVQMSVNPGFNMEFAMQLVKLAAKGIINQVLAGNVGKGVSASGFIRPVFSEVLSGFGKW